MAKAKSRPPSPPLCPKLASQPSSSRPMAMSQTHQLCPNSPPPLRPTARSRSSKLQLDSYRIKGSDQVIMCGDCVLIKTADATMLPYVARVKKIETSGSQNAEVKVKVCWFYRPEDCIKGREKHHGSKEIFSSDHQDVQSADSIEAKCYVYDISTYMKLETINPQDFFCRCEYKPSMGTFVPESLERFCTCSEFYNPDEFMIQCEKCSNWFHPPCIGLSVEQAKNAEHFFCDSCMSTSKNILEKYEKSQNPVHGVLLNEKKCFDWRSTKSNEVKEDELMSIIGKIFAKYDEVWSEKLASAKANVSSGIKALLDEYSTTLALSYKEHSRALITEVCAAISASRVEGEEAGITHGQTPELTKDMGQNTVAERERKLLKWLTLL